MRFVLVMIAILILGYTNCSPGFSAVIGTSASSFADSSPADPTPVTSIELSGSPLIVFDHTTMKQQSLNIPDAQVTAWKNQDGTVNLTVPHYEMYRMKGPDLLHLAIDPSEIFSSTTQAQEITENHYNYHHWFSAPYTLDGNTVYTLAHSEWYACLLNGDCETGSNQINSWVTTLNSFVSTDGGASWRTNGTGGDHVVAALGYTWTGTTALSQKIYQRALNHTGVVTPTRLIKEGDYYYSIGYLNHRNFSDIQADGSAPIDKFGYILLRTKNVTTAAGWEAWGGSAGFAPLASGSYQVFLPQLNGASLNASQPQMIYDIPSQSYVVIFNVFGVQGPIYYMTTSSLAQPVWSAASSIAGSNTFSVDPRNTSGSPCNTGFQDSNYVSLLDDQSPGLNFEFANGSTWLFYVANPAACGGDNLARDIYRARLTIRHESSN